MPLLALDLRPDAGKLRSFGFAALCVFGGLAIAAVQAWPPFAHVSRVARMWSALALLALANWAGLCSLFHPRANRPLYLAISLLAYPLGVIVSYALLALLFFGLFTPIGLLLRALGKDPLQRRAQRDRPSYWTTPRKPRDNASYFRQF